MIGHFWEDICFNTGPMISPDFFRNRVVPRYRQITEVLKAYDIDTVIVDCDGYIEPLVAAWLDGGVNIMFPLERAGRSDPVALRRKFGPRVLLMGGIDKRKIALGGDEIVRELEYLAPLVDEGGFVPHCDHLCPADVSLENYRFYLQKKREIFGMPVRRERVRAYPCEP
jgi:uroporphyrinogen decarboxylase